MNPRSAPFGGQAEYDASPPPLPLELKLGLLDGEGGEDVPTFGQLLPLGVGVEARVGLATQDMVDDVFRPPRWSHAPPPPVCTHHPLFLSCSAHEISPVTVRAWEILTWNGAYDMEVVKGDSTDGDVEVTWALEATMSPTRPAPTWQLLHAVPEWKRAKESKKGTWTMTCPCECEVCNVFYPVVARTSREVHDTVLRIRKCFRLGQPCRFTNFTRHSHGFRMDVTLFHLSLLGAIALLAVRSPVGHAGPQAIPPGRAHCCSSTVGPLDPQRALEFGRRHLRSRPRGRPGGHSRSSLCTHRPRRRGRRKPRGGDRGHYLPRRPPPHHLPLHAAVPAPVRMEARPPGTEAGKGGVPSPTRPLAPWATVGGHVHGGPGSGGGGGVGEGVGHSPPIDSY